MTIDVFGLLKPPQEVEHVAVERLPSHYSPLQTFQLPKGSEKRYQQQYADMYFLRLAQLKPIVEQAAAEQWDEYELAGERAKRVDRVLDVRQGELCWVVGTVYVDMPLKPNVLDDIAKEHFIAAPPPREKYISPDGRDQVMLEDESGRLRLTGDLLQSSSVLVTGCIIAALGTENADGVFEVIETKIPDLPRQPERWERDEGALAVTGSKVKQPRPKCGRVALVSGLEISGSKDDSILLDMLLEFLLGEATSGAAKEDAATISRLVIAGNSLFNSSPIPSREEISMKKANKKYGYDASSYNALPTECFDTFLSDLLPSMPVTLLPGKTDPASVAIPQQPLHAALFPHSRSYSDPPGQSKGGVQWLDSVTNPWEGDIDGWRFLGSGGQPVDDVFKYVEGDDRLEMMENMLRWRNNAPTAPDTLWSYPFQEDDPLVIRECPHVYFAGNQPEFGTTVIEGPAGQQVRLITIPSFRQTGKLVLVDMETLETEVVQFEVLGKA